MPPKPDRYRLLLDEMFPSRDKFPLTNKYHDLKHVGHDYRKLGIKDREVVKLAKHEKRFLISKNKKHLKQLCEEYSVVYISVLESMRFQEIDRLLMSELKKHTKNISYINISHKPRKRISIKRINR